MDKSEEQVLKIQLYKSITKAAKALGVSQPALSSSLSNLETKLGYSIFDRSQTPLLVTEEGKAFIHYLQQKKKIEIDLKNRISDIHTQNEHSICIGAPSAYVETKVIPAISEFLAKSPKTVFSITEGVMSHLENQLLNGDLDLFISTSKCANKELKCESIGIEKIYLCVPADSKYADLKKADIRDFYDQNFIFLHEHQPLQELVDRYLTEKNLSLKSSIKVDQISSAIKFVEMGDGVCFVTNNSVNVQNENSIKLIPIHDIFFSRDLYLVTSNKRYISNHLNIFIDILKNNYK